VGVVQTIHHGNIEFPEGLRWMRNLIVTPELHRVHHSMAFDENNANFSNFLSVWDRVFGSLRARPRDSLRLGLPEFTAPEFQRLDKILATPWLVVPPQILVRPATPSPP
jgi:sterol desaturase/sphingolipid hydroxylase (fatty acid hydroxylase superfamily)